MADFTIFIGSKNCSSWSLRPRLAPVPKHGALAIWETLAMFAPVTTRFVTHAMPLDPVCGACIADIQRWPAMQERAAGAKAEPWVIGYDVNAGAA